jgi:hypothetical protein
MMPIKPTRFRNEQHEDAYRAKVRAYEATAATAATRFPAGTKMHVTAARGLSRRARAGIVFNGKASIEVEVVDGTEAELAKRVAHGEAVVSPLGAAAIVADDALIVHGGPRTRGVQIAQDDELVAAKSALAAAQAELAKLRTSSPPAKGEGRPERLAPTKADKAKAGDDFGEDKPKA